MKKQFSVASFLMTDDGIIKIGVFGGGGVGKTALALQYVKGQFTEGYIPTIEDEFTKTVVIDGKTYTLAIIDTAGQDDFKEMRYRYFQECQVFIFVFSIVDTASLSGAEDIWVDACTSTGQSSLKCILAANKEDLRSEMGSNVVSEEEGQALANKLKCKLVSTSAKTGTGVQDLFEGAVRAHNGGSSKGAAKTKSGGETGCCEIQ